MVLEFDILATASISTASNSVPLLYFADLLVPERFSCKYAHAYELFLNVLIHQVLKIEAYYGTYLIFSC